MENFGGDEPANLCWIAKHDGIGRNIPGHNTACANHRVLSDRYVGEDRHAGSNRSPLLYDRRLHFPVAFRLKPAVLVRRTGEGVINKHHAMSDKHVVLDGHSLADEGVTRNLASLPDLGVLLNFNKGTDFGLITDFTAVQIDEVGQLDVCPELHVRRNTSVIAHN